MSATVRPLDDPDRVAPIPMILFGLQHVLVMAASPITTAFLVSRALSLSPELTLNLIGATFLVCGLGSILQSLGPWGVGSRLPFVMVPGGAPAVMFVTIARATDLQTATGAVLMTAVFYFAVLPVFARCLRFFPRLVIGTMLLLVAVNLVAVYGRIITGAPGTPGFADPVNVGLALATIGLTLLFVRVLPGTWGQLSVLLGLVGGAVIAAVAGRMQFAGVFDGAVVSLPTVLPFGMPRFDVLAALPLLLFSVISMAEATSQTVAITEVVGRAPDARRDVPRTIRGDAVMSLLGGLLGTSLIITSGENIGIVRATGVRSRYVTATAGVILVLVALVAPLGRLANAVPAPVVGGTAIIVFCIIGALGIDMLRRVDLREGGNLFTLASALALGLLPILVPGFWGGFPGVWQVVLGNGLAVGTITAVVMNIVFHHTGAAPATGDEPAPRPGTLHAD